MDRKFSYLGLSVEQVERNFEIRKATLSIRLSAEVKISILGSSRVVCNCNFNLCSDGKDSVYFLRDLLLLPKWQARSGFYLNV